MKRVSLCVTMFLWRGLATMCSDAPPECDTSISYMHPTLMRTNKDCNTADHVTSSARNKMCLFSMSFREHLHLVQTGLTTRPSLACKPLSVAGKLSADLVGAASRLAEGWSAGALPLHVVAATAQSALARATLELRLRWMLVPMAMDGREALAAGHRNLQAMSEE